MLFNVLPCAPWLKPAFMPNRHPLSRVPAFASIAWGFDKLTHHGNGYAALPIGRMTKKNPSWIFWGLQNRYAILHV
ncbi:MAG: hypothetical protein II516_03435, partial [Treponema sp.]|nr:hypothetical protein [Treponema sp.]